MDRTMDRLTDGQTEIQNDKQMDGHRVTALD